MYGILEASALKHAAIVHGVGVGGGSLVYANVLLGPPREVLGLPGWPTDEDWGVVLGPHYERAKFMLGAVEAQEINESDELLRQVVDEDMGGGTKTFERHTVGVFYGDEPKTTVPDPYFGGEGPDRAGCIQCSECQSGCKHNAKNTLDRNYLYLAEKGGAKVHPETEVTGIRPLDGGGFEIHTQPSLTSSKAPGRVFRCRRLVLSAGAMGTVRLLLECKRSASLPNLSNQVGEYVRTNAEAFGAVTSRDKDADFTQGVTISAGVYGQDGTHFEAIRWGEGHDLYGVATTVLTGGGAPWPRWLRWLGNIVRHPVAFITNLRPRGWAKRSFIIIGMQPTEGYMRFKLRTGWRGRGLQSELVAGQSIASYIPSVNEVTRRLAHKLKGTPHSVMNDILFGKCTTAHILGGAIMGRNPGEGVCDPEGRVYGYDDLYIADGSLVPVNLRVNPSLTITALSEYVMSRIPASHAPSPGHMTAQPPQHPGS